LGRRGAWLALAVVLAGGLALRVWGIGQGLPYAYSADEADHFVPHAIAMFGHGLNPHYFANPPGFTYLLHFLLAVWFGGRAGVEHANLLHPTDVYVLARAAAAVLGTAALWLLYLVGARLFGRAIGLLAAALEAVAFLPVFYAHLALNDVPTLAPLTLSLLGTAGILRKGRMLDYLLAGIGLGLACATKYTAGAVLLPLIAASATRYLERDREPRSGPDRRGGRAHDPLATDGDSAPAGRGPKTVHPVLGLALAGLAAVLAFLLANPYAILDYQDFHHELVRQSSLSAEAQGKLGAPKQGGLLYYVWTLTWGLGWVPALAALGGAVSVWRFDGARGGWRLGWLLVPAPLLYLAFMGIQGRYFGRWLLPIFPILCLLAALFVFQLAGASARLAGRIWLRVAGRREQTGGAGSGAPPGLRTGILIALVVVLLAQGLYYSVHSGMVLARADTRNLTRAWMLAHIPAGAPIVVEPVAPDGWARESGLRARRRLGYRWVKYPSLVSRISPAGSLRPGVGRVVGIEEYERTLSPALIGFYESHGYCWVISGSTESGRAFADPKAVPLAIAYYRALAKHGEVVYRGSPYARAQAPVAFNFDWSFDYYPRAYHRPGPEMTVYRLHGGRCT
jgi:4-amino-4-deoxy-L-arabinose transferase-like glycosyltransferase